LDDENEDEEREELEEEANPGGQQDEEGQGERREMATGTGRRRGRDSSSSSTTEASSSGGEQGARSRLIGKGSMFKSGLLWRIVRREQRSPDAAEASRSHPEQQQPPRNTLFFDPLPSLKSLLNFYSKLASPNFKSYFY
jgi:hypothetical protein